MGTRARLWFVTFLTVIRLPLVLVFFVGAIVHSYTLGVHTWLFVASFAAMLLSALTDLFDGYFARKFNVVTKFGAHVDPLMDKFFYLACLPLLVFVAGRNGNLAHAIFLLVLTMLFLARDQWVTFLRSIGSIYNVSGAASWAGKLRTAVNFPLICSIYYWEEAPARLQFFPAWLLHAFEILGLAITILSLYTYTRRYWPYLRRASQPGDLAGAGEELALPGNNECIDTMATGVAHDFNNLLAAIAGNNGVILRHLPQDAPIRANAEEVRDTTNTAIELAGQIMKCAGKGAFVREATDLSKLVHGMEESLREEAPPNVTVEFDLTEGLPSIPMDRAQMREAVRALLRNAFEALIDEEGKVSVSVHANGSAEEPANRVCIDVRDTGCGMSRQLQSRVMSPFFTTRIRGRGLGLSIASGVVRAHDGELNILSEPGKGTTVCMTIPAKLPVTTDGQP